MSGIAIFCSGQGYQGADMFDLLADAPEAGPVFERARRVLGGEDPRELVRRVTNDALHADKVGQILCCTQAMAAWAVLSAKLPRRSWSRATASASLPPGASRACWSVGAYWISRPSAQRRWLKPRHGPPVWWPYAVSSELRWIQSAGRTAPMSRSSMVTTTSWSEAQGGHSTP